SAGAARREGTMVRGPARFLDPRGARRTVRPLHRRPVISSAERLIEQRWPRRARLAHRLDEAVAAQSGRPGEPMNEVSPARSLPGTRTTSESVVWPGSEEVAAAFGVNAVQLLEDHPLCTLVSDACAVAVITTSEMFTCGGRVATQTIASATS